MKKNRKILSPVILLLPIIAILLVIVIIVFVRKSPDSKIDNTASTQLSFSADETEEVRLYSPCFTAVRQEAVNDTEFAVFSEECDGYFLKMHNLSEFGPDYMAYYSGLDIKTTEGAFLSSSDFCKAFDLIWEDPNRQLSELYLELDPLSFWESAGESDIERYENLKAFTEYFALHPETNICVIYSFPYVDYWVSKTTEEYEYIQNVYQILTDSLLECTNLSISAPGNQEWLISNSKNYISMFSTNSDVSLKLVSYCLFTDRVAMTGDKLPEWFADIKKISLNYMKGDYSVTLPANTPIVFFGDSIMDFYRVSYGIPSLVSSITGVEVYNLARGGMSLASHEIEENAIYSFETVVSSVVSGTLYEGYKNSGMKDDFVMFKRKVQKNDRVVFVIVLGINDYLNFFPSRDLENMSNVGTTYGGMVDGITRLKKAYPNSEIVVVAPYRLSEDYNSTADGDRDVPNLMYCSYIAAIEHAAMDTNSHYLSLFGNSPIGGDTFGIYLEDGVHPTEQGELVVAQIISRFLEKELAR